MENNGISTQMHGPNQLVQQKCCTFVIKEDQVQIFGLLIGMFNGFLQSQG
jgi:hypothetical protein